VTIAQDMYHVNRIPGLGQDLLVNRVDQKIEGPEGPLPSNYLPFYLSKGFQKWQLQMA